jgi:uncharacterized protein YjbJ (UPF0337 family)
MKDSVKNKVEGNADQLAGKVKEKVGEATNNPRLEGEGEGQQFGAKVQKKVGDIQKVFDS